LVVLGRGDGVRPLRVLLFVFFFSLAWVQRYGSWGLVGSQ
jgi:hypothetical protein